MWKIILSLLFIFALLWFWNPNPTAVLTHQADAPKLAEPSQVEASQTAKQDASALTVFDQLAIDQSGISLKGTEIDGLYAVDDQGHLILNDDIKHRFEYFLSTLGEFELDQVLNMIKEDIHLNLQEPARSEALKLFNDYILYKKALVELEQGTDEMADFDLNNVQHMRMQLEQLRNKRREYFSPEAADAFFGFDEIYDDYMLSKLEIMHQTQLTEAEKQAQLSALEDQLPPELSELRDETQRISNVFSKVEAMKASGASAEAQFDVNAQAFGQDAALRIQALEKQRTEWKRRVNTYLEDKAEITNNSDLSEEEKNEQYERLKQSAFDDSEQRRLKAYELMATEQD